MPDHEINAFTKGVHNLLSDELIPADAASDENNWITQDGRIKLVPGRLRVGAEGAVGSIQGETFGYKIDGTKVHWRKIGTKIQYYDGSAWQDTVTGLTATADYTFANYSSLAGTYTIAWGIDGIYKMHNANPGSYKNMYAASTNFKGYALIDRGRSILWNRPEDKTGLYGSKIDPQGANYTTVSNEVYGTGDGATLTFAHSLAGALNTLSFQFGVTLYVPLVAALNITGITAAASAVITVASTATLAVGDSLIISGVVGMTEINNQVGLITALTPTTVTVNINSTSYTAYSSGGKATKATIYTDTYLGGFTGLTSSIVYATGACSATFGAAPTNTIPIIVNYQWENSNVGGITDFRKSATRVAAEGFVFPQDEGGDAIQRVVIGQDGAYYSLKSQSAYRLELDTTDISATNLVYRRNMGVLSHNGGVSMQKGIVFMNTSNLEKPQLTILQRNPIGGDIEPTVLFPQFKFANYLYDDCTIETYERYIVIACKTANATSNDTILLCDLTDGTVDISIYNARTFANDGASKLYIGSSITQTVYQLFSGYDDDGLSISNYWISKAESLRPHLRHYVPDFLKKHRRLRLKGRIQPNQYYEVYVSYDNSGFQLVGTVRGSGSYVDSTQPQEIGTSVIGGPQEGGDVTSTVFPYYLELKLKAPKFRTRKVKFIAKSIGYVDIEQMVDRGIVMFETKLPKRFRVKQNVSLDGLSTDQANPTY